MKLRSPRLVFRGRMLAGPPAPYHLNLQDSIKGGKKLAKPNRRTLSAWPLYATGNGDERCKERVTAPE